MILTKNDPGKHNIREYVSECEKTFDAYLDNSVRELIRMSRDSGNRILALTGPSCAGKTTAARKMTDILAEAGMTTHIISIDDFFFEREKLLKEVTEANGGKIDFDSIKALDVEELTRCIDSLLSNKPTKLPLFDFETGSRRHWRELTPNQNDVFIFEGIQVLYPEIYGLLSALGFTSAYICPQSSLKTESHTFLPNEIRFLRRLVRDHFYRGASPDFTMKLWQSVRENEEKNIFPYEDNCTIKIDSTLDYEINVLAPYLEEILAQIPSDSYYYPRAVSILSFVSDILHIDKKYLSDNSLYWEFIKKSD